MIAIKGTVKIGGVLAALTRMGSINVRAVFGQLRKPMSSDQDDHKIKQRGPKGPWKPLASTTLARYARLGIRRNRKILNRLPDPRRTKIDGRKIEIRSPVRWSMVHQDGPKRVGRGAIVPQRQFYWISPQFLRFARREFRRAMIARFFGWRYP